MVVYLLAVIAVTLLFGGTAGVWAAVVLGVVGCLLPKRPRYYG